jgi:hypothetical protein
MAKKRGYYIMQQFLFWFLIFCVGLKLLWISTKVIYAVLDKPGNYPESDKSSYEKSYYSSELEKRRRSSSIKLQ